MSVLSQFFNRGSAGSGFIDVETLILSGGGGGGDGSLYTNYGGGGGGGAVYYGFLSIEPGSSCPVIIGAGGDRANGGTNNRGSNGGDSSVTTPVGTYRVAGGGGGGGLDNKKGRVGGTGGGDWSTLTPAFSTFHSPAPNARTVERLSYPSPTGGPMPLYEKNRSIYSVGGGDKDFFTLDPTPGPSFVYQYLYSNGQEKPLPFKNGAYHGYSGGGVLVDRDGILNHIVTSGCGGGAGSASSNYRDEYSPGLGGDNPLASFMDDLDFEYAVGNAFISDITGLIEKYGQGGLPRTIVTPEPSDYLSTTNNGYGGYGGHEPGTPAPGTPEAPTNGNSGVVIMRYPTQFSAASFSDPTAVTDLSPQTAGYRTYKFTASATITFPQ